MSLSSSVSRSPSPKFEMDHKIAPIDRADVKKILGSSPWITEYISPDTGQKLLNELGVLSSKKLTVYEVTHIVTLTIWSDLTEDRQEADAQKDIGRFVQLLAVRSETAAKRGISKSK